jgi:hypothetical protein
LAQIDKVQKDQDGLKEAFNELRFQDLADLIDRVTHCEKKITALFARHGGETGSNINIEKTLVINGGEPIDQSDRLTNLEQLMSNLRD